MKTSPLVLCIVLAVAMTSSGTAADDVTSADVDRAVAQRLEHPYLHFSAGDVPDIRARIKHDPAFGDVYRKALAEGNRLLHAPIDRDVPDRHTNARYEADYSYESFLMKNAGAAYNLAFLFQMTGERKYAEKAFEYADVVCDQPTWIHSVHEFPDIYDRVWPWGARDDQPAFGYSQHADHYVFRMAAVYDWLYPALTRRQRDRIRGALLEKAILRVRGNYEYHWWASAYRCNWCAVCNASLGVAAIALLTEDPQLTDVIAESWNRISRTLDEVKSGGWQEGLGYLAYTVRTSLTFADALKRITDGEMNLYTHPRFDDALTTFLYCQIPPNRSVHFGDSGGRGIGSYHMLNELMLERGSGTASWLRDHLTDGKPASIADLFKPRAEIAPSSPEQASIRFPDVEWIIMRRDFTDPSGIVVAAKCGMNDDPHHGHLDCGHFSLYMNGCEFICDHGSAGYDKAYFDEARWDYPLAGTGGHNCVMVNGVQQEICKRKNQPWNLRYGGEILAFDTGEARDTVLMDPSNAYPDGALENWRRRITLDKHENITVVLDKVACRAGDEIEARFHSEATQHIRDGYVLLEHGDDMMALIPASSGDYTIRAGHHDILLAQRNASLRTVPYVGTVATAKDATTTLAAIILPVESDEEASVIAETVELKEDGAEVLSVSLVRNGRKHTFTW